MSNGLLASLVIRAPTIPYGKHVAQNPEPHRPIFYFSHVKMLLLKAKMKKMRNGE